MVICLERWTDCALPRPQYRLQHWAASLQRGVSSYVLDMTRTATATKFELSCSFYAIKPRCRFRLVVSKRKIKGEERWIATSEFRHEGHRFWQTPVVGNFTASTLELLRDNTESSLKKRRKLNPALIPDDGDSCDDDAGIVCDPHTDGNVVAQQTDVDDQPEEDDAEPISRPAKKQRRRSSEQTTAESVSPLPLNSSLDMSTSTAPTSPTVAPRFSNDHADSIASTSTLSIFPPPITFRSKGEIKFMIID